MCERGFAILLSIIYYNNILSKTTSTRKPTKKILFSSLLKMMDYNQIKRCKETFYSENWMQTR